MATGVISLNGKMPVGYITTGLSVRSGCSIVYGGYARFGKLVLVAMRIEFSSSTVPTGNPIVWGLPLIDNGSITLGNGVSTLATNKTGTSFNLCNYSVSGVTSCCVFPNIAAPSSPIILGGIYLTKE